MSASAIVTGIVSLLLGIVGLIMLPRAWSGYFTRRETRYRGRLRSHGELTYMWWPFGNATRRGLIRGFGPVAIAWCGAVIGFWVAELNGGQGPHPSHVAKLAAVLTVVWVFVGLGLVLTIMFFNWPKIIVPPPHRAEPGAVSEWRTKRGNKPNGR